jgi:RNA polymerase sigma-70 factor, ECF subfamily
VTGVGPDALDLEHLRRVAASVAYRMVGSRTEAEDLAQEALVRLHAAAGREQVRNPEAFVTTVVSRLSIDHLRLARVQREQYIGPWLPEPVTSDALADGARAAEVADTLSFALMVVLESLGPVERAAFLLREVFGYGYPEVAEMLGRSEPACRQLVSRARQRVERHARRRVVPPDEHRRLLDRFLAAARDGDVEGLRELLAADATLVSDGGPDFKAARHPIRGRHRAVRFLRSVGPSLFHPTRRVDVVDLDGEPGFVVVVGGRVAVAGTIEVDIPAGADGPRITGVRWVINPDKLGWVTLPEDRGPDPRPTPSPPA